MSGFDVILLVACVAVPVGLTAVVVTGAVIYRHRLHRAGMERFRAACRALGLRQGEQFWEGTLDGVRVGACWARYRYQLAHSAKYERVTSYRAWLDRPLSLDLDAFARARGTLRSGGYTAHIEPWRRSKRPPRVVLEPDPFRRGLKIHAADAAGTRARFARPEVVAAVAAAMAACTDVRLSDRDVELLSEPYEADPAEVDHRLRLAARIARALAHPPA